MDQVEQVVLYRQFRFTIYEVSDLRAKDQEDISIQVTSRMVMEQNLS